MNKSTTALRIHHQEYTIHRSRPRSNSFGSHKGGIMKFLFTALTALIVLPWAPLEGQIIDSYGLKASLVSSRFSITDRVENIDYIEGASFHPSIGIFARSRLTESFNVETEISYLQKGASKVLQYAVTTPDNPDGNGKTETMTSTIDLNYLQFGVNVQPKIQLGKMITFVSVGPSINYLLSVDNFLAQEDVKSVTFGYNIGLGAAFDEIIHAPIFFEVKYCGDFSPFYSGSGKYWNDVFLINIGVNI